MAITPYYSIYRGGERCNRPDLCQSDDQDEKNLGLKLGADDAGEVGNEYVWEYFLPDIKTSSQTGGRPWNK
jgi:hypothetical protein